jgi:glycosyltransferase involved in cell wall biosynthesis
VPDALKVSIIIPAYNEAATLRGFLPTLKALPQIAEILVIDDASTDDTARVAESAGARVISHPFQRGNGAAVKTGLRHAQQDTVLIMDADGQHAAEEAASLLAAPAAYDLVVGARPFQWLRFRDFGNLCLARIAQRVTGRTVQDLTSGLRRMNKTIALRFWYLYPEGFSFPTTSTLLFITSGYAVTFIPITNRARPGHASKSKLRPFYEGVRFLSLIYRIVLLSHPLRFFGPLGILLMLSGFGWTLRTIYLTSQVSAGGALLFLSGLTLLLFGTIADQLSQIRKTISRLD